MNDNILIGNNTIRYIKLILDRMKPSDICFIVDKNTYTHCYSLISKNLPKHKIIIIQPGENHKNIQTCRYIWKKMTEYRLDRHSIIFNLGGGVIGDMGGFCAATYKRGVNFVQCPTSLLAQVDASIGGKLGVNFDNFKNHIGLFSDPDYVVISNSFLNTLPIRELKSGYIEIIKHFLIASAPDWERQLSMHITKIPPKEHIIRSLEIKHNIVSRDQKEKGIRKKLNFGHTIGHAIEKIKEGSITHGEAIAIGIIAESWLSKKVMGLNIDDFHRICDYIQRNYPKINLCDIKKKAFIDTLCQDKKNYKSKIMFSLMPSIGKCSFDVPVSQESCWNSLVYYKEL